MASVERAQQQLEMLVAKPKSWRSDGECFRHALEPGRANDVDGENATALCHACKLGYVDLVKALLANGADPNWQDPKPLERAIRQEHFETCHLEIVNALLDAGANAESMNSALIYACEYGYVDLVKALPANGADPNWSYCDAHTPLERAIRQEHFETCHLEIVNALLDAGANAESMNHALIYASSYGHLEAFNVLVNRGADVCAPMWEHGPTVLNVVCKHYGSHDEATRNSTILTIGKMALAGGADIDYKVTGEDGQTALIEAVDFGYVHFINFLIDRGADIEITDHQGHTALVNACWIWDAPLVVKTLIERGADTEYRGNLRKTCFPALQIFEKKKFREWSDWYHGNGKDYVRDPNGYPDAATKPQKAGYIEIIGLLFDAKKVRRNYLLRRFVYASLLVRWILRTLRTLYAPPDPRIDGHRGGVLYQRSVERYDQGRTP